MRPSRLWLVTPVLVLFAGAASGNDELIKLSKDPNQWVMPSGDYANTRYSTLNQIPRTTSKTFTRCGLFDRSIARARGGAAGYWRCYVHLNPVPQ